MESQKHVRDVVAPIAIAGSFRRRVAARLLPVAQAIALTGLLALGAGCDLACDSKTSDSGDGGAAVVSASASTVGVQSEPTAAATEHTHRVAVSIPPLQSLVQGIVGEGVPVDVLVPAGRTVHGFEPTAAEMRTLSRATHVVTIGLGLEGRLIDAVDRAAPVAERLELAKLGGLESESDHEHVYDKYGVRCCPPDGGVDAHLWLDPVLVKDLLTKLAPGLPDVDGQRDQRLAAVLAEIDEIDRAYAEALAPFKGRRIVPQHAAWGRLADRYGIVQATVIRPIETAEPSPARIAEAVREVQENGVRVLVIEPQFGSAAAERIASVTGASLIELDPLGRGDWAEMMRDNLTELVRGLQSTAGPASADQAG